MNPAAEAARTVARQKLAGLFPGQTGINVADEVADSIHAAIEAHLRELIATEIEAVDPAEWALAGQHAGRDAAAIARSTHAT